MTERKLDRPHEWVLRFQACGSDSAYSVGGEEPVAVLLVSAVLDLVRPTLPDSEYARATLASIQAYLDGRWSVEHSRASLPMPNADMMRGKLPWKLKAHERAVLAVTYLRTACASFYNASMGWHADENDAWARSAVDSVSQALYALALRGPPRERAMVLLRTKLITGARG